MMKISSLNTDYKGIACPTRGRCVHPVRCVVRGSCIDPIVGHVDVDGVWVDVDVPIPYLPDSDGERWLRAKHDQVFPPSESKSVEDLVHDAMFLQDIDLHEACEYVADSLGIPWEDVWNSCTR